MSNLRLQRTRKKRFLIGGKKEKKKNRIQCPKCETKFSVNKLRGRVQCPECGKEIIFGEKKKRDRTQGYLKKVGKLVKDNKKTIAAIGVAAVGVGIGSYLLTRSNDDDRDNHHDHGDDSDRIGTTRRLHFRDGVEGIRHGSANLHGDGYYCKEENDGALCLMIDIPDSTYTYKVSFSPGFVSANNITLQSSIVKRIKYLIEEMTRYLPDDIKCGLHTTLEPSNITCTDHRSVSHSSTNFGTDLMQCCGGCDSDAISEDSINCGPPCNESLADHPGWGGMIHRGGQTQGFAEGTSALVCGGNLHTGRGLEMTVCHEFAHEVHAAMMFLNRDIYQQFNIHYRTYQDTLINPPPDINNSGRMPPQQWQRVRDDPQLPPPPAGRAQPQGWCGTRWNSTLQRLVDVRPTQQIIESGDFAHWEPYACKNVKELWAVASNTWFGMQRGNQRNRFMETPEIMKDNFSGMYQFFCDVYNSTMEGEGQNSHRDLYADMIRL